MKSEYFYEPTDLDDEEFLSDVPVEILENSIETQFEEPLNYRKKDYIQTFITRYEFSKDNTFEDDSIMIDVYREKFIAFMEQIFQKYLNVGFTNIDDMSEDDQHELIHLTYRFFIKNIKKNFVNIILNYINENENEIENSFEKKKDVTINNFKLEIENDYDVLVIGNLGDIIQHIFDELIKSDDIFYFLDLCVADEPILELDYVRNAFEEMELTGNFIESYIDMIDDEFVSEIQSKVRNKILKKYPKRIRKEEVELDEEQQVEESTIEINEE